MHKIIKTGWKCIYLIIISSLWVNNVLAELSLPKGIIALEGSDAPALILNDIDGQAYDIRQSRGKWVFTHFWASWCGPCRREMKTIAEIAPKFANSKLQIVLINTAEDEDTVFSFLGHVAPELNTLMDADGLVTEKWKPRGLPATYLVSPAGKLEYVVLGGRPWNQAAYLAFLNQLIKE